MKKFPRLAVSVAIALFLPTVSAADMLRIAVADHQPPFSFINQSGERTGFSVDLAAALCQTMAVECTFVPTAAGQFITGLEDGKYDAVVANLAVTDENTARISFTNRYYRAGAKFVRTKGDKTKISYQSLAGKVVAVPENTVFDSFLSAKFDGVHIRRFATEEAVYAALLNGDVDFVINDRIRQAHWVAENEGYEISGPGYSNATFFARYAIAVRKDDEQYRRQFNTALRILRTDGRYREINRRYFPFSIY